MLMNPNMPPELPGQKKSREEFDKEVEDIVSGQDNYEEHKPLAPYIVTFTGRKFYLLNPKPEDVSIVDIAAHLGALCRFTGASRKFYSVAQHCVLVSKLVPSKLALVGLLHDAGEAYANDISAPFKSALPDYKKYEKQINECIRQAFNIPSELWTDPRIKEADMIALKTEAEDLMAQPHLFTTLTDVDRHEDRIDPWAQNKCKFLYAAEFARLTGADKLNLFSQLEPDPNYWVPV